MPTKALLAALGTYEGQTGLIFLAIGSIAVVGAAQYPFGTLAHIGAGFFPMVLGVLLCLVGLTSLVLGLKAVETVDGAIAWRALCLITLAVALSGLLLVQGGLLVAIPVLVITSALASRNPVWSHVVGAAVVLTALAYLVFIRGLNMQIPLIW